MSVIQSRSPFAAIYMNLLIFSKLTCFAKSISINLGKHNYLFAVIKRYRDCLKFYEMFLMQKSIGFYNMEKCGISSRIMLRNTSGYAPMNSSLNFNLKWYGYCSLKLLNLNLNHSNLFCLPSSTLTIIYLAILPCITMF